MGYDAVTLIAIQYPLKFELAIAFMDEQPVTPLPRTCHMRLALFPPVTCRASDNAEQRGTRALV
jgi:hypothetical protein